MRAIVARLGISQLGYDICLSASLAATSLCPLSFEWMCGQFGAVMSGGAPVFRKPVDIGSHKSLSGQI